MWVQICQPYSNMHLQPAAYMWGYCHCWCKIGCTAEESWCHRLQWLLEGLQVVHNSPGILERWSKNVNIIIHSSLDAYSVSFQVYGTFLTILVLTRNPIWCWTFRSSSGTIHNHDWCHMLLQWCMGRKYQSLWFFPMQTWNWQSTSGRREPMTTERCSGN